MNKNFLSKKSWHTGSMQHMEKVWKAEQRAAAEAKKTEELRRQLEKEKQMDEILAVRDGGRRTERLEWMYRGTRPEHSAEEFALGKAVEPERVAKEDVRTQCSRLWMMGTLANSMICRRRRQQLSTPSLFQSKASSATQDAWSKLMEDPLLAIKRQEKDKLAEVVNNPMKRMAITAKVRREHSRFIIVRITSPDLDCVAQGDGHLEG